MMSIASDALIAFSLLMTAYFALWSVSQIVMSPLAARVLWHHYLSARGRSAGMSV